MSTGSCPGSATGYSGRHRGNSSVGRARASQARGRGFESRFPLEAGGRKASGFFVDRSGESGAHRVVWPRSRSFERGSGGTVSRSDLRWRSRATSRFCERGSGGPVSSLQSPVSSPTAAEPPRSTRCSPRTKPPRATARHAFQRRWDCSRLRWPRPLPGRPKLETGDWRPDPRLPCPVATRPATRDRPATPLPRSHATSRQTALPLPCPRPRDLRQAGPPRPLPPMNASPHLRCQSTRTSAAPAEDPR